MGKSQGRCPRSQHCPSRDSHPGPASHTPPPPPPPPARVFYLATGLDSADPPRRSAKRGRQTCREKPAEVAQAEGAGTPPRAEPAPQPGPRRPPTPARAPRSPRAGTAQAAAPAPSAQRPRWRRPDPPTGRRGAPRPQQPPLRPPRPDKEKRRRGRRRRPGLGERRAARAARAPRRRGAGGVDSGRAASGPAREGGAGRRGAHHLPASPRRTRRDPSPAPRSPAGEPQRPLPAAGPPCVPLRPRRWDSWCTRSPKMTCGKVCGKGTRFFLEPGLFLCLISTKCA